MTVVEAYVAWATPDMARSGEWSVFYAASRSGACRKAWNHVKCVGKGVVVHEDNIVAFLWPPGTIQHQVAVEKGECLPDRHYWAIQGLLLWEDQLQLPKGGDDAV